jgi:hypothetical protein
VLTPRRLKYIWKSELEKIPQKDWWELLELSKSHEFSYKHHWWHARYREEDAPFARLSNGRFALGDHPVSYWAGDYELARVEATEELREDSNLTFHKTLIHVSAAKLYSLCYCLKKGTPLLDLTEAGGPFLLKIEELHICSSPVFVKKVLEERRRRVYPITQAIAEAAFDHGFGGIVWRSVRSPIDVILGTDTCLVLFDEGSLINPYSQLSRLASTN